jgi:succinoglycan biosynthesis transport protein ExoP
MRVIHEGSGGFGALGELEPLNPGAVFSGMWGLVRRQWTFMLAILLGVLVPALAYLSVAPSYYTATAMLMIDAKSVYQSETQQTPLDITSDTGFVDSQVEILKSETVASKVIRDLKLDEDPEFVSRGALARLVGALIPGLGQQRDSANDIARRAVKRFTDRLRSERVGLSYVIEVSFVSRDPEKSARIANAVANGYINDQLEAKFDLTKRAGSWLQTRLNELRDQAEAADQEVQRFKAEKGIVDTEKGLISSQRVSEVNTQLLVAKAKTAEAHARVDRIANILSTEVPDGTVADELDNQMIMSLREKYAALAQKEADISSRFGKSHQAAVNLRRDMTQLRAALKEELSRIAETFKSELEIAQDHEKALSETLNELIRQASATDIDMVRRRELESVAESYRTLYDTFLQRYVSSVQQQSFPISEARIITEASPPADRSSPRQGLIVLGALLLGLMGGFGAAAVRDQLDDAFRTPAQIESELGIRCLGILTQAVRRPDAAVRQVRAKSRDGRDQGEAAKRKHLARLPAIISEVVQAPFSQYSETIRALKVAIDQIDGDGRARVIGFTSAVPKEGKSTTAINLAQLYGQSGRRVVVVDADLRSPSLSRWLTPSTQNGLFHVVARDLPLEQAIVPAGNHLFSFLPAGTHAPLANTIDIVGSQKMVNLLGQLRAQSDIVIVDLPPIAPIADVAAIARHLDGLVMLVLWGQTPVPIVKEALHSSPAIAGRTIGAVLSNAKAANLKRYNTASAKGKYYGYGLSGN